MNFKEKFSVANEQTLFLNFKAKRLDPMWTRSSVGRAGDHRFKNLRRSKICSLPCEFTALYNLAQELQSSNLNHFVSDRNKIMLFIFSFNFDQI